MCFICNRGIGDGAYTSNWHILIKYQQPEGGVLTKEQVKFNSIFNYWRLRDEHIIGEIKKHDMFDGVFRGSYTILKACLDLTVHLKNVKIKLAPPRYETCGPWTHKPEGWIGK